MFGDLFGGWHGIVILAIVVLLFGASKLPALAKSVGQSARIFKNEIKPKDEPGTDADSTTANNSAADASTSNTADTTTKPTIKS
jgi:sec-independent protein translocase protein TatA